MSTSCCGPNLQETKNLIQDKRYRYVLCAALIINATMFLVEIVAGWAAGSTSLQADALDFLGDSANYGISLWVAGMALAYRARAAMVKGMTMGLFGVWVIGSAVWHAVNGTIPDATTMGVTGLIALIANTTVLFLLWSWRSGDSNMRSVWLCSRNDVIANFAVILAAFGVFGTQTGWPDIIVALIISGLALVASFAIIRQAAEEMRHTAGASNARQSQA